MSARWDRERTARAIADRAAARLKRRARQPARHDGPFLTARRRARIEARIAANVARQNERRQRHLERCARAYELDARRKGRAA